MNTLKRIFASIVVLAAACFVAAQANPEAPPAATPPPPRLSDLLTNSGLQLKLTYKYDFRGKTDERYFDVLLKGTSIFTRGAAATPTDFGVADDPIKFGDAPLSLIIGNSLSEIGGTLLSTAGVQPLQFQGTGLKNFRLLAGLDAKLTEDKQSTGYGGVEWLPLGPSAQDKETFIGISARYESHDPATAGGDTESSGTAAIRGRLGIGIGLALSNERLEQIRRELAASQAVPAREFFGYLAALAQKRGLDKSLIPNRSIAVEALSDLKVDPAAALTEATKTYIDQKIIALRTAANNDMRHIPVQAEVDFNLAFTPARLDAAGIGEKDVTSISETIKEEIVETVKAKIELLQKRENAERLVAANNPTLSLFTEFDASYGFAGDPAGGKRARGVFSANLKYSTNPKDENAPYFWVRYEAGRTRAEPDKNIRGILVMAGFRF